MAGPRLKDQRIPNVLDYDELCAPIDSLDLIEMYLEDPPLWTARVLPIRPRSRTVVQNVISDCHIEGRGLGPLVRFDSRFTPRTLVCHDYKGGYLEDKYTSGTNSGNEYSFYHWAHIDIFVYFSHHLITIPPLCWTNNAHKNGVKILGTFITEGEGGAKTCAKIFKDEDTMRIFGTHLTQLCQVFGFDGWFLNIENPLPDTAMLRKFVEYLTVSVHGDNPDNLVIWYDSVVEGGALAWQNELNAKNRCFFDCCDGIFLNYNWNEEKIKRSAETAGHRALDVYVGLDVFGRGVFGGGKFNSYKAAQVIRRHHLSMAIFAPGWSHESLPKVKQPQGGGQVAEGQHQAYFENFVNHDAAFWNSLWPYLYTHPVAQLFSTRFFIGVDQTRYDMFAQQQQLSKIKHPECTEIVPDFTQIPTLANKCTCIQTKVTARGIRCLITKQPMNAGLTYTHRLFICDLYLKGTITVYCLTRATELAKPAALSLSLLTSNRCGALRSIRCLHSKDRKETALLDNSTVLEVNPAEDLALLNYIREGHSPMVFEEDLAISAYQFDIAPCHLLEIACTLEEGTAIYLNAFGIESKY